MKEYLTSILTVILVSGLAMLLMPDGEQKKGVRTALSLIVLLTIISPIRQGIPENFLEGYETGAFFEEEKAGKTWLAEQEASAIEEGVVSYLASEYRVSKDLLRAEVVCEVEEKEKELD